jgi:hypothetical protein
VSELIAPGARLHPNAVSELHDLMVKRLHEMRPSDRVRELPASDWNTYYCIAAHLMNVTRGKTEVPPFANELEHTCKRIRGAFDCVACNGFTLAEDLLLGALIGSACSDLNRKLALLVPRSVDESISKRRKIFFKNKALNDAYSALVKHH